MNFVRRAGMRAGIVAGAVMGGALRDGDQVMDLSMSALVRFVRRMPAGTRPELAALRRQYAQGLALTSMRPARGVAMREVAGHGLTGRLYTPKRPTCGALLYFHGGGFMMGGPGTHDALCRQLALPGLQVLSVSYRLAPEHPFPAAHDDAATALVWAHELLGPRVAVGGDSAGANLAAGRAHEPGVILQVLLYPVVDMVAEPARYPSIARFAEGYLLTAAAMQQCAAMLVPPGTDLADPRLSPIRGPLAGAAPAVVCVAGFDPLHDQGVAYVEALRAAGVRAQLLREPGLIHGFADFGGLVPAARYAVERLVAAVVNSLA